jgi:hypothetical protein
MIGYRYNYTIERVGGVVTKLKDLTNRIAIDAEANMIIINTPDGRIFLQMRNVIRITEEEVEI